MPITLATLATLTRRAPVRAHVLGLVIAALSLACDGEAPADERVEGIEEEPLRWALVSDPARWSAIDAGDDPFADERPAAVRCAREEGWRAEAEGVEIDTGACDYLALAQPLPRPIAAGERLRISAWWQSLIAAAPSEGHLALAIDGVVVWEERVAIPGPADARDLVIAAPEDAPAGAPITLHLHNHGANTWRFQGLFALEPAR